MGKSLKECPRGLLLLRHMNASQENKRMVSAIDSTHNTLGAIKKRNTIKQVKGVEPLPSCLMCLKEGKADSKLEKF